MSFFFAFYVSYFLFFPLDTFFCFVFFNLMSIYEIYSGKLGKNFYQRTKGGAIQCKSLLIPWKAKYNPSKRQIYFRKLFAEVVSAHNYTNRAEMYSQIKLALKGDHNV